MYEVKKNMSSNNSLCNHRQFNNNMYKVTKNISPNIFRAFDMRGLVGKELSEDVIYTLGLAIGTRAKKMGIDIMITSRDGRLSGPAYIKALHAGLTKSGCDVIHIGVVPTPIMYYACCAVLKEITNSGISLTASHNPAQYNGLKIVLRGKSPSENYMQELYKQIQTEDLCSNDGNPGKVIVESSIMEHYIEEVTRDIKLARPLKIAVDCGNGVAGVLVPKLLEALGCQVTKLYCEVDGHFPNHHPDPTIEENLRDLIDLVQTKQETAFDLGLAFDGDGDRLGVVTGNGQIIWADRQMMLYSQSVLQNHPGGEIIFDVKCTRYLGEVIQNAGGKPVMWKTGHAFIKTKLHDSKGSAPLAGEMSGHIFFNDDRWYGFDDASYTAARLLEIVSWDPRPCCTIFSDLPDSWNTPELKIPLEDEKKNIFMQQFLEKTKFDENYSKCIAVDGIRVEFKDSWGLIRASNTTPNLTLRFEGDTKEALENVMATFKEKILEFDPLVQLPF